MVVGAGSIGLRHRRVLSEMGLETAIVSRRGPDAVTGALAGSSISVFASVTAALDRWRPDHVVVATETARHLADLDALAAGGFTGSVVVEKPVCAAPQEPYGFPFRSLHVGYQLRLHPAVVAARDLLREGHALTIVAHVGQHLAAWRPGRAIGDSASARIEDAGGALRDLSHELDLVTLLGGPWERVVALGGRSGVLGEDVRTDDRWTIILELASGAFATVHLDALDHVGQRRLTVVGADRTVALDLVAGSLTIAPGVDGRPDVQDHAVGRDEVLARLHRTALDGDAAGALCTLAEGMATVELIEAIERSSREGHWMRWEPAA